ncbi:MAG: hypothetical protein M1815_003872 [Lichina confinis]|nr:MAG: hypothetical protein M1815_003872 [Lichina confinis]
MENAAEQKPGPIGQPAVWAENRHAMCECLPYYRAFQSGAYVSGGLCHGLLMDKQAGERDVVSEHVVIARAGGGMTRVDGEFSQTADQTSDSSVVQSMTRNKEQDVPLVLILGSENPKSPTRLPHRYCVMDHFHVTRIWCEKVGSKNTYMFRFQKLDTNRPSWWMGQPQAGLSNRLDSTWQPAEAGCLFCKTVNEQIYTVGWMCLNEKCPAFWSIRRAPTEGPLEYTPEFLMPTAPRNSDNIPTFPLRPPLPRPDEYEMALGFSRACWKGIVCPQCGACNSRVEWAHWHCRTQGCGFVHAIPIRPVGRRVVSQSMDDMFGHALPTARTLPVIEETSSSFDGNYRITVLQLPDCGTIAHVQANHAIITRTGGPDSMFLNLQRSNMGLKRFPLGNSVVSGALTAHFAVNFGMPYKYIVSVDSKSFSEAHPTIMNVLHRLSWAAQKVVHDGSFTEFNELLAVGYFEDQRMNYHDDGEYGLGPTVATMSLGGDAVMSFRMKRTHYTGFSKSGVFKGDGAPVRGCLNYETRKTLYEAGDSLSAQEREEKINELRGGRQGNANPAVTLQLKHGDMVIMHGANIQKYYEHAVHPSGRLRFALTCRHIDPNTVDEGQRWKAAYEHQPWMTYNGDIGAADSRDSI